MNSSSTSHPSARSHGIVARPPGILRGGLDALVAAPLDEADRGIVVRLQLADGDLAVNGSLGYATRKP